MATIVSSTKFEQSAPQQNGGTGHHPHHHHIENIVVVGGEHFAVIEDEHKKQPKESLADENVLEKEAEEKEVAAVVEASLQTDQHAVDDKQEEGEEPAKAEGNEEEEGKLASDREQSVPPPVANGPYSAFVLTEREELELRDGITKILQDGKGILTADETDESIGVRLQACEMQNSGMYRRRYRQLLFSTPNLSRHISAVVMNNETFQQSTDRGDRLGDLLRLQGIAIGVKMDGGTIPLIPVPHPNLVHGNWQGETLTQGMDNMAQRAMEYKRAGCTFAKWRCAFYISENTPSQMALEQNSMVMARFAMICQRYGLVPIIEPDISSDGGHTIEQFKRVTELVFSHVIKALILHGVFLEGVVIKMGMITAGPQAERQPTAEQVAQQTLTTLHHCVPAAVPGVAFRCGNQPGLMATRNLSNINKIAGPTGTSKKPWQLTFCFGHDLQADVMEIWHGCSENVGAAQKQFLHRARASAEAERGKYESEEAVALALSGVTFAERPTRYY